MKECVLVLDNLRSVENTGSIFRTAEGLGVLKIILIGTTPTPLDRFGRERADFIKISLGAEKSMKWEYAQETKSVLEKLKSQNLKIIALEQDSRATKLRDYDTKKLGKFALIVGSEVNGVSAEILDYVDEIVEISMMGQKESLNVSVATGVALFKFLVS